MSRFLLGAFIAFIGFMIIWKSEWMLNNFGRIALFDKFMHTEGGTRLGYKLIGMLAMFIGTLMMTGLIDNFMGWFLGPLVDLFRASPIPSR
jgi:hypothetical protein